MKNYLLNLSTPKKLAILAGLLAVFALIIGNSGNKNKISVNTKELALSTIKDQDKINVITLADWLIKDKLDFTIVDLRPEKEFTEYTIPGSVNVRMEDLLNSAHGIVGPLLEKVGRELITDVALRTEVRWQAALVECGVIVGLQPLQADGRFEFADA